MDRLLYAFLSASLLLTTTATGQVLDLNLPDAALPTPTPTDAALPTPTPTDAALPIPTPTVAPVVPADSVVAEADAERPAKPQPAAVDTQTVPVRELKGDPIQRGPIHEAFAEPLQLTPQPTKVLKRAPPAMIEELPPESSPTAKNMRWISGYWAWDAQRDDYVWVSGVWRKTPKDRTWVAGRWEKVDGGHRWVSGAWMKTGADGQLVAQEVVPLPPKSLEEGPTSPAPSDDHFWIPGIWKQNETGKYAWRAGFWSQSQENWVWVPDHNVWTPDGCMFVAGYWDYPWERRGTLYAPCSFGNDDLSGRVCYRPSQVIDTNQWLVNLWVGPGYGHYYYGDYYDHTGLGYSPWYSYYGANRGFYDPFYSYYRWRFPRTYGIGLYGYLHGLHSHYSRNSLSRPGISLYGYNDSHRRRRSHSSLYGNVRDLYGRHGHSPYRDHYGDRHYDDHYRNRGDRGYDARSILDSQQQQRRQRERRQQQQQRRRVGYANGQAVYSDRGRGGVTRGEIGTRGAPGITRAEIGTGRSRGRSANTDNLERMRRSVEQRRQSAHATTGPSTSRPNTVRPDRRRPTTRPASRPASPPLTRSTPPITRTPRVTNPSPRMSRPTPRVNRPAPSVSRNSTRMSRPAPRVNRPAPAVNRPAPRVNRPAPRVSRPAPRPARSSSPGFSTHGMKKARGADLSRQRANMKSMQQRKKGK